jgi:hypothetical protein
MQMLVGREEEPITPLVNKIEQLNLVNILPTKVMYRREKYLL